MPHVIDRLYRDHRLIERVLGSFEVYLQRLEAGETRDRGPLGRFTDFLVHFMGRYHFALEEKRVIELMEKHGFMEDTEPLRLVLGDHEKVRESLQYLTSAGEVEGPLDDADVAEILKSAARFLTLLRHHVGREDTFFYPLVEKTVSSEEADKLEQDYAVYELGNGAESSLAEFQKMAEALVREFPMDLGPVAAFKPAVADPDYT
jgi:hemerythrin-like domain-containing protein